MLDSSKSVRDKLLQENGGMSYLLLFVVKGIWVTILGGGLYKGCNGLPPSAPGEGVILL